MRTRTMVRVVAAVVLAAVLGFGLAPAAPAGADPADVNLVPWTQSPQYSVAGCRYKITWGVLWNTAYAQIRLYSPACNGSAVGVRYHDATGVHWSTTAAIVTSGVDGCGAYDMVQAVGATPSIADRAVIFVGTGLLFGFYAGDGTATQTPHSAC